MPEIIDLSKPTILQVMADGVAIPVPERSDSAEGVPANALGQIDGNAIVQFMVTVNYFLKTLMRELLKQGILKTKEQLGDPDATVQADTSAPSSLDLIKI